MSYFEAPDFRFGDNHGKILHQEYAKMILCADNLAIVENIKELQKTLQEWNNTFSKTRSRNESGES